MKKTFLFMLAASMLVACGSGEESTPQEEVVISEYVLDPAKSTLWWHGEENADHFHYGFISFRDGSLTAENDLPTSGRFIIDANSIIAETEGYPKEKMDYLSSHLKDTAFLFTAEYPEIKVTTGRYEDGKLHTTIQLLGEELVNEIPVEVTRTENGMNIKGEFTLDLADSKMKYITIPDPETGKPGAKSDIQFKLNLELKKK